MERVKDEAANIFHEGNRIGQGLIFKLLKIKLAIAKICFL